MNNSEYILITGGKGYIGNHLCKKLLKFFNNIIIFDLIDNNDLCDFNSIDNLFKKYNIKYVIHLASFKHINDSINNPLDYYHNNIIGSINLFNAMKKNNCFNIIFSSSASVYGKQRSPISENVLLDNIVTNPYAKTKIYIENILKDLHQSSNKWNIIILRYFNPVGFNNNNGLFFNLLNSFKNNTTFEIYGNHYKTRDGTCIRDFIHIDDLINSHIISLNYIINNNNIFKIYNVGTGYGFTIKEIVNNFNLIISNHGYEKIKYKYIKNRCGDIDINYADVSLINKELKWYHTKNLEDMIIDTLNF